MCMPVIHAVSALLMVGFLFWNVDRAVVCFLCAVSRADVEYLM